MPFGGSFGQSYSGLRYQPWQTGPLNDAAFDFLNTDFGNARDAFSAPYVQQAPWSNFSQWLQGVGGREMESLFKMENAKRIAQGGDLNSQMLPGTFLQSFDPVSLFQGRSMRDRGEVANPFTTFRNR